MRWARAEHDVAEIVDEAGGAPLRAAILRLHEDADRRASLAANAVAAGQRYFDAAAARTALTTALAGARR